MSKPGRIIYPPIWLLIGLITIFCLNEFLPLLRFTGESAWYLGGFAIVAGLIFLVHAGGMFKAADTDLVPFKNVNTLVTGGIYRVTRNPMYLGMTLVLLGTAITVGAFSALFVAPLFMLVIQLRFIKSEEAMLRELFGEQFDAYCRKVRRWL